ncbi:MAG: universal stress protein [Solirubrobacteraceae bacterium]|nr:universal stress protein [Solirubrobacteraceae bacterium]
MTPTYITGYESTDAARAALAFTRGLARATGANVVAAYVYPDLRPVPSGHGPVDLVAYNPDLTAVAQREAEAVVAGLPADVEAFTIAGSSVPHELDALARNENAALLAVGATHRGAVGRVLPGSIGERVVHGAPCPVLVVPEGQGERAVVRTIGVAYDGREQSRRALRAAETLADRLGASLVLIHAGDPAPIDPHVARTPDDAEAKAEHARTQAMRTTLERTAARQVQRDFDVSIRIPLAAPGPAIVDACSDGIDLLVAGSRAYGPLRSVLVGSVSRYLVDHAPCPVLVVPRRAALRLVADEEASAGAAAS